MRLSYFRIGTSGQLIMDKLSGKKAVVTSVEDGKITAAESKGGVIVEDGEIFEINEANAICFRFIADPNPKDVPDGYTFDEDNLIAPDGKKIALGTIVINTILGYIRGYVVLLCGEEDDNRPTVKLYNVLKGKFEGYEEPLSRDVRVVYRSEDRLVLVTDDLKKTDENGKETVTFSASRVISVYEGSMSTIDTPHILSDKVISLDKKGRKLVFEVISQVVNGELAACQKAYSVVIDMCDRTDEVIPRTYTEGKADAGQSEMTLIGPDGIYLDGKLIKVDTSGLAGYLNLVDTTIEPDGRIIRSLATNDRQVKKLVTVETDDRGEITTVQ